MPVLTAIDIIGIQSYIFASNRLRDVIAASHLVEWATSRDGGLCLDDDRVSKPEIIVSAGGNAILRFEAIDAAKQFILHYSRQLIEQTPGLDVAVAHQFYEDGHIARGLFELQIQIAKAKLSRRPQAPQLGLSVMQPCAITGLPASIRLATMDPQWVSSSIGKLRDSNTLKKTKLRWEAFLPPGKNLNPDLQNYELSFPDEMDNMGRTHGDTSLIGVVHIDGNGIGKRIQDWLVGKLDSIPITDTALIEEYQRWSRGMESLGKAVLRSVTNRLINCIEPTDFGVYLRGQPSPPRQLDFRLSVDVNSTIQIPMRPILLGGDDLTFICDGRVALDLATTALRSFMTESVNIPDLQLLGEKPVTACAGVALVKSHAPFDRSYQLCEDLCASAKRAKRNAELDSTTIDTGCWIDWHIGIVRPDETVTSIRERQYQSHKLTCRPYQLFDDDSQRLTWGWLDKELLGEPVTDLDQSPSLRNPSVWGERRNKVKTLATLVVDGCDAVKEQLETWQAVAAELRLPGPIQSNGFKGNSTPLLDAVELLDIHMRLDIPRSSKLADQEKAEVSV